MIFILYESYVLDQAFVLQSILQAHSIQNLESTQVAPDKVLVYYSLMQDFCVRIIFIAYG